MNINAIFGFLAALFAIFAALPYLRDVLKGKTTLERGTYTIWLILPLTVLVSQYLEGAQESIGLAAGDTVVALIFFGLCFKYGYKGVARRDFVALTIASLGIVLSVTAKSPAIAIMGAIFADLTGMILIIAKVYEAPGTETTSAWVLYLIAGLFGLLALNDVTLINTAYPLYAVLGSGAVLIAQKLGQKERS